MQLLQKCLLPCLTFCVLTASAAVPDGTQVQADLAGPYLTSAPTVALGGRGPLSRRLEPLMVQQAAYLVSTLKPWKDDPRGLLLTKGDSGEHGIRPNAHTAYGLAVMARALPDDALTTLTREACTTNAIAILRFVLPTHGAGGVKCTNGKAWNSQWQSALWANDAGKAAWLLWDELDPQMKWLAARMICDEADRFTTATPPMQTIDDTKAEENAWDSQILSLAGCMFPNHPHAADWLRADELWTLSSFLREADLKSSLSLHGKPAANLFRAANIHDDYTLENHGRVHPDYMNTVNLCLLQELIYQWGGRSAPWTLRFNTQHVYQILKELATPDGSYLYPNGQDWGLHRNPHWTETHAVQSVLFNDPQAARLFRLGLECMERMGARDPKGPIHAKEEYFFPSTQHYMLDMLAGTYLVFGAKGEGPVPVSEEQLWKDLAGNRIYSAGKFAVMRTSRAIASFSWGDTPMGLVLPLTRDLLVSPFERSMIGIIRASGAENSPAKVLKANPVKLESGFAVSGILNRGGGAAEQRFAFVAMDDGNVVYIDEVRQTTATAPAECNLGSLAVLNEPNWVFHGGERTLYSAAGKMTFGSTTTQDPSPILMSSAWYNLDDKLGITVLQSCGHQQYVPNVTPGKGRVEQLFHTNAVPPDALRHLKSGDVITSTVLVFNATENHTQTAKSAKGNKVTLKGPDQFQLQLHNGTVIDADLARLEVHVGARR